MTTKWSATSGVVALILSVGIALAQGEKAPGTASGQASATASRSVATLTRVSVHPGKEGVSIEITCSRPITPTPTMINDPSRLVLDFADTVSANPQNRISVNQDGLKSVRIGVQAMDPPTTRVVLDLDQSRAYQLVPDGNKLTVKLGQTADPVAPSEPEPTTSQQMGPTGEPTSPAANAAASQPVPAVASSASGEPGGLAPAVPDAVPNVKSFASRQEGNAAPEHPADSSSQTADIQKAAPVPPPDPVAASKAGVAPVSTAPNPATPGVPSVEAKAPASTTAAASNTSSSAAAPQAAAQTQEQAKAGQDSSATSPKPAPAMNDPVPHPAPAAQPLSLAAANVAPDLPPTAVTPKLPTAQPTPSDYVIGEQDVLSIVVWKERELSATVVVRPDGKITLPLVNEINVIGMTPAQLQALLIEKFKPFLNIPQVTVEVVQINSRKAYLIGEVMKTGTFSLNSSTTVLQIIAAAGGLRDFAKRKDIYILRNQNGKQVRYRFNYDEVIRGKNTQQNIILQPGDMVVVP